MSTVSSQFYFLPVDLLTEIMLPITTFKINSIQANIAVQSSLTKCDEKLIWMKRGKRQKKHSGKYLKRVNLTTSYLKA